MTFDLAKIVKAKRDSRRQLAARPIAEKLAMLDAMCERELAIRRGRKPARKSANILREKPTLYKSSKTGRKSAKG
jgi:hypothetical protein